MLETSSMTLLQDREEDNIPDVVHPVVTRHPESGRDAVFISETVTNGIVGMTVREGFKMTQLIQRHVIQRQVRVQVAYEPHPLVMWDNRCLVHRGLQDDTSARGAPSNGRRSPWLARPQPRGTFLRLFKNRLPYGALHLLDRRSDGVFHILC